MTNEQFDRELGYQIGKLINRKLKEKNIKGVKYSQINDELKDKFLPIIG